MRGSSNDGTAGVFAVEHRDVGGPQEFGEVAGAQDVRGGGADGHCDVHGADGGGDGLAQGEVELVESEGAAAGADPGDDGELVAAEPADETAAARPSGDPGGGLGEGQVADGVAEPVVDLLEAVEVGSAQVPRFLNVARPELACQVVAAAVPRTGSGSAGGT